MSTETAEIVLAIITAIGVAVWISALQFLLKITRFDKKPALPAGDGTAEALPANWFVGSMDVDGEPDALLDRAVSMLVSSVAPNPWAMGPLKIRERGKDRIIFENPGGMGPGMMGQGLFRQGRLVFSAAPGQRTHIDYALELTSSRWMLSVAWCCQGAGLLALIVGFWIIYNYCVPSLNPGVRMQTVQMLQTSHFLWPPFLFAGLYRQRRQMLLGSFETLLNNLPYTR
jgi:hypothetical protein